MSQSNIDEIEIKVAFLEAQLNELNEVVVQLQQENMMLRQTVSAVTEQLDGIESNNGQKGNSLFEQLENEKPPHY